MNTTLEQGSFSYAGLTSTKRDAVMRLTGEIRQHAKVVEGGIVAIGERLIKVKDELDHGQFGAWLESEFAWSQDTAGNLMNIARLAKDNPKFSEYGGMFGRSALILLAQPSTPEAAREEALQRAEAGEKVTHGAAREIIQQHKPQISLEIEPDEVPAVHPLMEAIIEEVAPLPPATTVRAAPQPAAPQGPMHHQPSLIKTTWPEEKAAPVQPAAAAAPTTPQAPQKPAEQPAAAPQLPPPLPPPAVATPVPGTDRTELIDLANGTEWAYQLFVEVRAKYELALAAASASGTEPPVINPNGPQVQSSVRVFMSSPSYKATISMLRWSVQVEEAAAS